LVINFRSPSLKHFTSQPHRLHAASSKVALRFRACLYLSLCIHASYVPSNYVTFIVTVQSWLDSCFEY